MKTINSKYQNIRLLSHFIFAISAILFVIGMMFAITVTGNKNTNYQLRSNYKTIKVENASLRKTDDGFYDLVGTRNGKKFIGTSYQESKPKLNKDKSISIYNTTDYFFNVNVYFNSEEDYQKEYNHYLDTNNKLKSQAMDLFYFGLIFLFLGFFIDFSNFNKPYIKLEP